MKKHEAIEIIWDYMHMGHALKKADAICALGSHDILVGEYAAQLWLDGWAPILVCAGSGTIHQHNPAWSDFVGKTEADLFAEAAIQKGVPKDKILIENKSQNTGENYEFMTKLLKENEVELTTVIVVQKPYMERRTFATGKVWWPEKEIIVTSPPLTLDEYQSVFEPENDYWLHAMVGDMQRIKEYPRKGFQIEQDIPNEVWLAYEQLIEMDYTKCLIKD